MPLIPSRKRKNGSTIASPFPYLRICPELPCLRWPPALLQAAYGLLCRTPWPRIKAPSDFRSRLPAFFTTRSTTGTTGSAPPPFISASPSSTAHLPHLPSQRSRPSVSESLCWPRPPPAQHRSPVALNNPAPPLIHAPAPRLKRIRSTSC
ncbi:hypothetical protein VPH35_010788 [Triticum aestivum]